MATTKKSTQELADIDRAHIIHPYLPKSTTERVIMARGQDCALWDTDGKEYLDATGGLWLAQIGHGRDEVAAVAAEQPQAQSPGSWWALPNQTAPSTLVLPNPTYPSSQQKK